MPQKFMLPLKLRAWELHIIYGLVDTQLLASFLVIGMPLEFSVNVPDIVNIGITRFYIFVECFCSLSIISVWNSKSYQAYIILVGM